MNDSTPASPAFPPVTAVMVVRNDATTVRASLASIGRQSYPEPVDVVVAVLLNTDGSSSLVDELAAVDTRITVLPTTSSSWAIGLNEAIAAARSSVIVRVDPQTILADDYVERAVEAMIRTGAAALVGRSEPAGTNAFETAVATAIQSRLGLRTDPLLHDAEQEQGTDRPAQNVLRRRALIEAGLYNEEIRHGQSWDMTVRLKEAGQQVVYTPALHSRYRVPGTVSAFARSMFAEGLWRGEFARAFPDARTLRFLQPMIIVAVTITGFVLGAVGFFGLVAGALGIASVVSWVLFALLLAPLVFVIATVGNAVAVGIRTDPKTGLWSLVALPLLQFSWGFGYIAGYLNIEGAADTVIVDFG